MKSSLLHSGGWNPGELRRGFVQTIPLGIGVTIYGLVYGMMGRQGLLPFWMIPAMSLFVFAGSSQMLAAEMMISGSSPLSVIITVLAVNLRHVVMSADMAAHVREAPAGKKALAAFFLTDEAYAVSYLRFQREKGSVSYILGCGLDIYLFWNLSSVAGYWFGTLVPPLLEPAFGFAMAAAFLSMLIPTVRSRPALTAVLVSAVTAICGSLWLPGKWYILLSALTGSAAGFLAEELRNRQKTAPSG